jgi:hypothetical protein
MAFMCPVLNDSFFVPLVNAVERKAPLKDILQQLGVIDEDVRCSLSISSTRNHQYAVDIEYANFDF